MKKFAHITVTVCAVAGAVAGLPPTTAAAHPNAGTVQDTIDRLQALGYSVGLNGNKIEPLSRCMVLDVHPGDPGTVAATRFTTIWLDISCPPSNNSPTS